MRTFFLLLFLASLAGRSNAEMIPDRGIEDPRVRTVDYAESNVVRIVAFFGVSTHIQFADGEVAAPEDISLGDKEAWTISDRGNHIFLKPKKMRPDTNLTIITNRRVYHFILVIHPRPPQDSAAWKNPDIIYSLKYRYPDEEVRDKENSLIKQRLAAENSLIKSELRQENPNVSNIDYWIAGSPEISPTKAGDNGRFIFLTFPPGADIPSFYAVDEQGNEHLVNFHMDEKSRTIGIQKLFRKLVLRKGIYVACIVNKSFRFDSQIGSSNGTVSKDVNRKVKGD